MIIGAYLSAMGATFLAMLTTLENAFLKLKGLGSRASMSAS
jgi:hypothetical protein